MSDPENMSIYNSEQKHIMKLVDMEVDYLMSRAEIVVIDMRVWCDGLDRFVPVSADDDILEMIADDCYYDWLTLSPDIGNCRTNKDALEELARREM